MRKITLFLSTLLLSTAMAADLTVYSGRSKALVDTVVDKFKAETGLNVDVRYGDTASLTIALLEEQASNFHKADIFWAQDAGALAKLDQEQLLINLPADLFEQLMPQFYNPHKTWIATSGRARVLAYTTDLDRVNPAELPESILELTDDKWRNRVAWAPTNASFQAFVTALRMEHGDEFATAWLTAINANHAKKYPNNNALLEAIAAGDADIAIPNHYYLKRKIKQDENYPVAQKQFDNAHDVGNLINIAGVGVLNTSQQQENALLFAQFLLAQEQQLYFAEHVMEYPVLPLTDYPEYQAELQELVNNAPQLSLEKLDDLEGTLTMMREAGVL